LRQVVVVGAAVFRDGKILLIKRSKREKACPGYWEFPSGKVEYREDPNKAVVREIKEETGLQVKVIKPISVRHYTIGKGHRIEIDYLAKAKSQKVRLSKEHESWIWASIDEAKRLKAFSDTKKIIKLALEQ
jgi:8-oxo-dGTP diphosphatase